MIKISKNINQKDEEIFVELHSKIISNKYPFSKQKTAHSFIQNHKDNFDKKGYFTKNKTIWKITDNSDVCGYTVVSEKRGGSIKFGPTMIIPERQNKGYGGKIRKMVEDYYCNIGYRKAYSTTNLDNKPAIFYITKIGYKIELHLENHFEKNKDELVLSKFLNPTKSLKYNSTIDFDNLNEVEKSIYEEVSLYCDDIDNIFFDNIRASLSNMNIINELLFINKKKKIIQSTNHKAIAITTPKRGGCIKLSPLVLSLNNDDNDYLFKKIISYYKGNFHKLYTLIPLHHISILKKFGFFIEGIIREPYKENVDLIIMSKFI